MNMSLSAHLVLAASLFLVCLSPRAAQAKEPPALQGAKPIYGQSGSFSYCLVTFPKKEGPILSIARSPKEETNLGLTVPKGGFKPRENYDLTLTLSPLGTRTVRAIAMDSENLLIQYGKDARFFKALETAPKLTVAANGNSLLFDLPAKSIATLESCVAKNRGTKGAPSVKKSSFPRMLGAILTDAGAAPFMALDLSDIPPSKRPADFAWRTGDLIGGVRERDVPKGTSLDELVALHLKELKEKCRGAFTSRAGKGEKAPGFGLVRAEAVCRMKTDAGMKDIVAEILFYLTKTDHFVSFTHEGEASEKARAIGIRNKLAESFLKAAREEAQEERK